MPLAAYADTFADTTLFLSELALQSNLEAEQNQPRDGDDEEDDGDDGDADE